MGMLPLPLVICYGLGCAQAKLEVAGEPLNGLEPVSSYFLLSFICTDDVENETISHSSASLAPT